MSQKCAVLKSYSQRRFNIVELTPSSATSEVGVGRASEC